MMGLLLPDDALDEDLQQRIGRNLLVFQRIEANFKKLMSVNRIEFTLSLGMTAEEAARSFQQAVEARTRARDGQTLGALVGDYRTEVLAAGDRDSPAPPEGQCVVCLGYQLTMNADVVGSITERLAGIVSGRNVLAHGLLERLGSGAPEQLERTREWLDEQHALACTFLRGIREELRQLGKARVALLDQLAETDFPTIFEQAWLAQSPLAAHFDACAVATTRSDGWADYTAAAQSARDSIADELAELPKRYGHSRVRLALAATGLFEFRREPTTRGGQRLLYRRRPGGVHTPLPEP